MSQADEQIARRRESVKMLKAYRARLAGCHTLEALVACLVSRADEINKSITEDIDRDEAFLKQYEIKTIIKQYEIKTITRTDP